jgi:hypothetical protein
VLVAHRIERRDYGRGELASLLQHGIDHILGKVAIEPLVHRALEARRVLERERDIGDGRAVSH